ncbi:conserved hypothetical protein [Theileria equi strain WA]|uniref:Uncharacterized protein n=1 Tax=Theileria equi strain WA TaxID=1537102 RepID=L1LAV8_THEEQ|nr:conserved hypothetical protein [Theileria equi strain WA]EKX72263.1 conserved hypothetical protein [Theileria equi strain WA]|eukprot:XP_004831715.1 conserved hypothetical protein [Theileria equi strain WA]
MSGIPSITRDGGWFKVLLANFGMCITAALCSLMLLQAVTLIPQNSNFQQRIEFDTVVKYYLSDYSFKVISILHHIGDLCCIICGILTFSKLIDMLFVQTIGYSFAIQIYPHLAMGKANMAVISSIYGSANSTAAIKMPQNLSFIHSDIETLTLDMSGPSCDGKLRLGITLGYIVCALLCLRLSACALEETTTFHVTSFVVLLGCSLQLAAHSVLKIRRLYKNNSGMTSRDFTRRYNRTTYERLFGTKSCAIHHRNEPNSCTYNGDDRANWLYDGINRYVNADKNIPTTGELHIHTQKFSNEQKAGSAKILPPAIGNESFSNVLLTFVDNYSLASTTPSWANEMTLDVKVAPILWMSTLFSCIIYYILGILISSAFPANTGSIVNDILMSDSGVVTSICILIFVIFTAIPDVVFGCITTKYNLLNLGYCGSNLAYFWGCAFPFLFTWLLSNETLFMEIFNNIGLISAIVCDFATPVVIYVKAHKKVEDHGKGMYYRASTMLFKTIDSFKRRVTKSIEKRLSNSFYEKGESFSGEVAAQLETMSSKEDFDVPSRADSGILSDLTKLNTTGPPLRTANSNASIGEGGMTVGFIDSPDEVDYTSFKIIKAGKPRLDDHLYNVLVPINRKKFENPDKVEYVEIKTIDCRVNVFPSGFLVKNHLLIAYTMIAAFGGLAVVPPTLQILKLIR